MPTKHRTTAATERFLLIYVILALKEISAKTVTDHKLREKDVARCKRERCNSSYKKYTDHKNSLENSLKFLQLIADNYDKNNNEENSDFQNYQIIALKYQISIKSGKKKKHMQTKMCSIPIGKEQKLFLKNYKHWTW